MKQRWQAVVGCEWNEGELCLGTLRSFPGATIDANDDLTSFVVRFDAASAQGAAQVLRRLKRLSTAQVVWYTRVASATELL